MARVPKILHYCWFIPKTGGKPWSLVHHVCVKSAVERIRPDATFLYYENEPEGPWWELTKPLVQLVKTAAPREIFGRPLLHPAHQADVMRLQKLLAHGGIYLDVDILVHRGFDDLLDHSFIMGEEGINAEHGLLNAAMLAEPGAPFLQRWLEQYRSFRSKGRDQYWNEHSVKMPLALAGQFADEVTILPHTAFHWPLWTDRHLAWLFEPGQPPIPSGAYANHLWESAAWSRYLEHLTPGRVRRGNGHFHAWARPLLAGLPDDFGAPSGLQRLQAIALSFNRAARAHIRTMKQRTRGSLAGSQ